MAETTFDPTRFEHDLRHGHFRHREARGGSAIEVEGASLGSVFEPIWSRAHRRVVGHRARLEAHLPGRRLKPEEAAAFFEERDCSDRVRGLEAGLHMANYRRDRANRGWLLLSVPASALQHPVLWPPVPQDLFGSDLYAPHDLILELPGTAAHPEALRNFARYHQELGFAVCLADFGAGDADLAMVWQTRPDLVCLAPAPLRALTGSSRGFRRHLVALCRLLHETGCMVGVRDVDDARLLEDVLAGDADLVEGRAAATIADRRHPRPQAHQRLGELRAALDRSAEALRSGSVFECACEPLLGLPEVLRCYLLDDDGVQLTENLSPVGVRSDPRFWPLANAVGAVWAHREYFVAAMSHPEQVMATAPYLSLPDGHHCVTLSIAIDHDGRRDVLCCDLRAD